MNVRALLAVVAVTLALSGCASSDARPRKANLQEAARINTQLGVDYMRRGQFDHALEKLKRAIDQDSSYAVAHSSIAFLYQQRDEPELAEKHYRRAISLEAGDPVLLNNFGVFLCGRGKAWDAEKLFLKAAQDRRYGTPEVAWTNAGVCARTYSTEKAEQYLREALRINAEFPAALAQMASLSFKGKDYFRTRGFMQRFESVGTPTAETLWIAAQTERALGDELAARKYEVRLKLEFPESQEAAQLQKKQSNDS